MKKIIALVSAFILIFTLSACSTQKSEGEAADISISTEVASSQQESTSETPQESNTLTEVQAAYLFNKAFSQAAIWFNFYNENWNDEDSYLDEQGFHFAINHESINSIESLKAHLYNCFSKNLVDSVVSELYTEKNGKLYQYSPEAGDRLPEYRLDRTTAVISSQSENSTVCDITINMYFDDGPDSEYTREENETLSINFVFENGNWVIDNYFKHDLYPPYTWDHISPLNGDSLG